MHSYMESFPRGFKEQLEIFSSHGVMVSPHGAGLMNAMFMVPYSSVIEIFPYHLDHNLCVACFVSSCVAAVLTSSSRV